MAGNTDGGGFKTLIHGMEASTRRLKSNFDAIFEKYNRPFAKNDVINLSNLTIVTDKGSVRKIKGSNTFGASKLQSTRRKDESQRKQLGRQEEDFDPNVSMAIERRCVSYLNNSSPEEESEEELSDAETLSSDSSDNEDECDNEKNSNHDEEDCDEVDGKGVEEIGEDSRSSIEEDNGVLEEVGDNDSESDSESSDILEDTVAEKCISRAVNSYDLPVSEAGYYTSKLSSKTDNKENDSSRKQSKSGNNGISTDSPCILADATTHSNSCTGMHNQRSPLNTSITSSLSQLSFVSIQSPTRNHFDRSSSAQKLYGGPSLQRKNSFEFSRKAENNSPVTQSKSGNKFDQNKAKRNPEGCSVRKDLECFKSQAKVPDVHHVRSLPVLSSDRLKLDRQQCTIDKLISPRNCQLDSTVTLSNKFDSNKKISTGRVIECVSVSEETFSVPISPKHQQNLNKPDAVFKSPQGIKVKRICPTLLKDVKDKRSSSSQMRSPLQKKISDFTARKKIQSLSSLKCGGWQNERDRTLESQSTGSIHKEKAGCGSLVSDHTENSYISSSLGRSDYIYSIPQDLPASKTFDLDASFSSPNEESDDEVYGKCEHLLQSLACRSPQKAQNSIQPLTGSINSISSFCSPQKNICLSPKNKRVFSNGKKQMSSLSHEEPAQNNSLADLSLTSSLRNLDIHPGQSVVDYGLHCQTELREKRQFSEFGVNTCNQCSSLCHAKPNQRKRNGEYSNQTAFDHCTSSSCSTKNVGQEMTSSHVFGQKKAPLPTSQCPYSLHTQQADYQQKPLSCYGFDQRKWMFPQKQVTSPNRQSEAIAGCRIKRKASGSFTSGYFTEASASPKYVKNGFNSSSESPLAGNVTFNIMENDHETSQALALGRWAQPNRDFSNQKGCEKKPEVENAIEKPPRKLSLNTFKRRLAEKRLQHISDGVAAKNIGNNPFSLQANKQQLSQQQEWTKTADSRVCKWVEAAISSENSNAKLPFHFASCPPKIVPSFRNHFSTTPSELMLPCHTVALQTNFSENQPLVNQILSSPSQKKDIGIQTSPNDIPKKKPNQCVDCRCSFPQNPKPSFFEHKSPLSHLEKNLGSRKSKEILSSEKQRRSFNSQLPFSGPVKAKTTPKTDESYSKCKNCFKSGNDSQVLKKHTTSLWRDTEVDMSAEEDQQEDSVVTYYQSMLESGLSSYQKEDAKEVKGKKKQQNSQDTSSTRSIYQSPRLSRFVRNGLDQAIGGNSVTRSFVESHSPRCKTSEPKGRGAENNSLTRVRSPEKRGSQFVMFPPSYINKFSPHNPLRIDSDATSFKYEENNRVPLPSLKDCLKSFRPRRHHKSNFTGHKNSDSKFESLTIVDTMSPCLNKPTKRRKVAKSPQCSPPRICENKPTSTSTSHYGQDLECLGRTSTSEFLKTQKHHSGYNGNLSVNLASVLSSPPSVYDRASTPIKSLQRTPDFLVDETISTIIDPVNVNDILELSDSGDNTLLDCSSGQSDSSGEIDLL